MPSIAFEQRRSYARWQFNGTEATVTTANEPQPSDASDLLAAWTPTLNAVLAWLETVQCDHTGLGFTPAERLQLNERWRREQRPRGRLGTLTAFATKADALSGGSGPASRLLALLRAHEMPDAGTLAAAAEEARGALARSIARPETANPGTARPGKSVLDLFMAMDLIWMSIHLHNGDDAEEAYDALFGPEEQRTAMLALYERREEFALRFPGTVQTIADFAVTSGHEAAALFAGRIAAFAPAREGWIPKHRDDLRQAKSTGQESAIGTARFHLKEAVRDFADFMKPAFKGWFEHRAWMRRSIEQELLGLSEGARRDSPARQCVVQRTSPTRATATEGGTTATIRGQRRVWLFLEVVQAKRPITWRDLVDADIKNASVVLDRRIHSRSASGTKAPKNAAGSVARGERTPVMATQAASLQNLGTRIVKDLGKLAYHWQQDGEGVVWNSDCQ